MRRLLKPLCAAGLLAVPAGAVAADAPPGAVQLSPNVAGRASELRIDLGEEALAGRSSNDERPRSLHLQGTRGLRINPRAVARRCTDEQADAYNCPERSRIGRGTAEGRAEAGLIGTDFTADIDVFLAPRRQAGDIAGVVVQVREPQSGERFSVKGRIIPLADGPFGSELRFEGLDGGGQLPPGVTVTLRRVQLTAGARRVVRRRVTVRRGGKRRRVTRRFRYTLLRNPRTCTSPWPYRLRVVYSDRTEDFNGSVDCRPR